MRHWRQSAHRGILSRRGAGLGWDWGRAPRAAIVLRFFLDLSGDHMVFA